MALTKITSNAFAASAVDSDAVGANTITTVKIADNNVTHAKLHTDMDLSSKTVTLPTISSLTVSGGNTHLDGRNSAGLTLDLSGTGHYTIREHTTNDIVKLGGTGSVNFIAHNISSGNVGIGQSNPDARLDLGTLNSSTAGSNQMFQLGAFGFRHEDTGGFNHLYLERNYGGWQTTPQMTFKANGNVGIGTDSPQAKLHVTSSVLIEGGSTDSRTLGFTNASGSTGWSIGNGIIDSTHNFRIYDNTAGAARVTVDGSGNVGIGITNPSDKLAVNGTVRATTGIYDNIWVNSGSNPFTVGGVPKLAVVASGAVGMTIGASNSDLMYIRHQGNTAEYAFQTYDGSNDGEIHLQPYGGKVGIGTANPGAPLQIGNYNTTGDKLWLTASQNGYSYLRFLDLNSTEGTYISSKGETYGGKINFGARWNTDQDGVTFEMYRSGYGANFDGARVGINTTSPNAYIHLGSGNAVGTETNPAIQIGGTNTYRLGLYTESEAGVIDAANGDNGLIIKTKTKGSHTVFKSSGAIWHPEYDNQGDYTSYICSISEFGANGGSTGRYLHIMLQVQAGDMFWLEGIGYHYSPASSRYGRMGGYYYSGGPGIYASTYVSDFKTGYQLGSSRIEVVFDTGGSNSSNRWGSYVFRGGTDTITSSNAIELVQYTWSSGTGQVFPAQ